MPAGIFHAATDGTAARSAKAPSEIAAKTRSPTANPSTPAPTSRTTPATSAPGTNGNGGFTWYWPRTISMSKKLQPAARISTPSMPGPTAGAGTSETRRSPGSVHRSTTTARIAPPFTRPS